VRSPRAARAALAFLLFTTALIGLVAAFFPHTFYEDFPFLRHWVELLPPYNEHLVTDVGGLYLGFAVLFVWAARTLQPTLVRAVCCAWLLTATLHLIFHITHLEGFDTGDAIGQVTSLAFLLVPAPIAIWAVGDARPQPAR
jgi:hypothetical protein